MHILKMQNNHSCFIINRAAQSFPSGENKLALKHRSSGDMALIEVGQRKAGLFRGGGGAGWRGGGI